jgi:DNA-binding Lrp family transcriptional regulator
MLDRIDCAIIRALQNNARISNKALAEAVHLAPSSCLERVRRLQSGGVQRGFHAELDPRALGIGLQAMIAVELVSHTRQDVRSFHDYVMTVPEVVAMYHVTGEKDFLVHVAVRDADHLRDMAMDAFTTRSEVARLETSLIYERLAKPGLPILLEAAEAESAAPG